MADQASWRLSMAEIRGLRPEWPEQLVQDYFARQEDAETLTNEVRTISKEIGGSDEKLNKHIGDINNPHQVQHAQTQGRTPDDHHPQLHDLDSHTDVDSEPVTALHSLVYVAGLWSGARRNKTHLQNSQPGNVESQVGDLWLVTQ